MRSTTKLSKIDINKAIELYKNRKEKELLEYTGYKYIITFECAMRNAGYMITDGFVSKVNHSAKKYKVITCNMPGCNNKFKAELDQNGVPYKRRCVKCSNQLRNSSTYKYSDFFTTQLKN